MHLETMRPAARQRETGLGGIACLAASTLENNISTVLVNRLRHRFGLSELHAAEVLRLASIGPKEGR
ncbi:hypothetical protein [Bosea sp. 47.2.35]|uniref:hypothetical protein n=1 Tax=Bosea sp. 47.2.35 TaxID=2969304 RepID=UPI0035B1ECCB